MKLACFSGHHFTKSKYKERSINIILPNFLLPTTYYSEKQVPFFAPFHKGSIPSWERCFLFLPILHSMFFTTNLKIIFTLDYLLQALGPAFQNAFKRYNEIKRLLSLANNFQCYFRIASTSVHRAAGIGKVKRLIYLHTENLLLSYEFPFFSTKVYFQII